MSALYSPDPSSSPCDMPHDDEEEREAAQWEAWDDLVDLAPCDVPDCATNVGTHMVERPEAPVDASYCTAHAPAGAVSLLASATEIARYNATGSAGVRSEAGGAAEGER